MKNDAMYNWRSLISLEPYFSRSSSKFQSKLICECMLLSLSSSQFSMKSLKIAQLLVSWVGTKFSKGYLVSSSLPPMNHWKSGAGLEPLHWHSSCSSLPAVRDRLRSLVMEVLTGGTESEKRQFFKCCKNAQVWLSFLKHGFFFPSILT